MTKEFISIKLSKTSEELLKKVMLHVEALDLSNSMESIGRSYRKEVDLIFQRKQVRKPSLKWPKLKESTLREKRRLGFGDKNILERTGRLRKGMTSRNNSENITIIKSHTGQFGSSNPYGNFHDDIRSPRRKLPLRNFSIPSDSTFGTFLRIIDEDIVNQLDSIGIKTK